MTLDPGTDSTLTPFSLEASMARRFALSSRFAPRFALVLAMTATLPACVVGVVDRDAPPIMFRDAPRIDAPEAEDDAPPPACELDARLGDPCEADSECSDGCFCNGREVCSAGTCSAGSDPCVASACGTATCTEADRCQLTGNDAMCDDGEPCNGAERCDAVTGCRAGPPPSCNDANACTIDACMAGMGCVYAPYDGDGDGEASRTCGGTDCDDRDGAVNGGAAEDCDNGIDDDCDGLTDILSPECVASNDTCATAEALTLADPGTSRFRRSTMGFVSDTTMACTPSSTDTRRSAPDAVFTFSLSEPRDVTLAVEGLAYNAGILLRSASACAAGPDLDCEVTSSSTVEPVLRYRSLPAGDYAIFVKTRTAGPFTLAVTLGAPTPPRDACSADVVDISSGGTFTGEIDDDDYVFSCHTTTSSTYDDAAHRLVIPAGEFRDVLLTATVRQPSGSTSTPYIHVTSACGDADAATSVCDAGTTSAAAEVELRGLGAGTYYVLVEGAYTTAGFGTYELVATITPSTGRARGDSCDAGVPVALTPGTPSALDLSTLDDAPDEGAFCSANRPGYRDGFYTFHLDEERDVVVTTTSGARHWLGVSSACGAVPRVLDCATSTGGAVTRRFYRLAAGDHFVNVSTLASEGTIQTTLTTFPPTPRPGNDLCAGAAPLVDGTPTDVDLGLFEDDQVASCSAAQDLDAYYTFTLATDRFVTLRAEGATSMALIPTSCTTTPTRCVTGGPPQITEVLTAGTYYVLVESRPLVAGAVRLRLQTSDP